MKKIVTVGNWNLMTCEVYDMEEIDGVMHIFNGRDCVLCGNETTGEKFEAKTLVEALERIHKSNEKAREERQDRIALQAEYGERPYTWL